MSDLSGFILATISGVLKKRIITFHLNSLRQFELVTTCDSAQMSSHTGSDMWTSNLYFYRNYLLFAVLLHSSCILSILYLGFIFLCTCYLLGPQDVGVLLHVCSSSFYTVSLCWRAEILTFDLYCDVSCMSVKSDCIFPSYKALLTTVHVHRKTPARFLNQLLQTPFIESPSTAGVIRRISHVNTHTHTHTGMCQESQGESSSFIVAGGNKECTHADFNNSQ
ncbi:hypothetical protein ATANTOWER_024849 [Ataeniobius toweri]|uniref:Uncharacterized protein n=1 Tax=Ataeniobius toweri TaxID=208326 RepID=A0ABU7CIX1_9TELE|nr:hypothetical protein [Ataeniobius toweri]